MRGLLQDRLACDFLRKPLKWAVSRVIGSCTMASRLSAASMDRGYGTGLKIPELREFLQEKATTVEQFGQGVGHGRAPGNDIGAPSERTICVQK
jgi:hypothetical protein